MLIALTRAVSPSIARCELTHIERQPIDLERARRQHAAYEAALVQLGCRVERLPDEPDLPDAVFVEDTALVLPELAVITRPGAASRRPEVTTVAAALGRYRRLETIQPPAALDGGDILVAGKAIYVGLSGRSDRAAVGQLQDLLAPYGYAVRGVDLHGCLHLKSAVTQVGAGRLLVNPGWIDPADFAGVDRIEIDPSEAYAANAVLVGDTVLYPQAFPRTLERLQKAGLRVLTVDASELAKAEGAVTCCSLIFEEVP